MTLFRNALKKYYINRNYGVTANTLKTIMCGEGVVQLCKVFIYAMQRATVPTILWFESRVVAKYIEQNDGCLARLLLTRYMYQV